MSDNVNPSEISLKLGAVTITPEIAEQHNRDVRRRIEADMEYVEEVRQKIERLYKRD